MQRTLLPVVAGAVLSLLSIPAHAQFSYQVTNLTLSGGDPSFPITDDVTFENLLLTEKFTDGTMKDLDLFDASDPTHTPATMLDTGVLSLETDPLTLGDPVHGAVSSVTLTGMFDLTNVNLATSFGGPITNVDILPDFSATLFYPTTTGLVNINAIDASTGAPYGAGTLALLSSSTGAVVPEPGACAFLAACGLGLAATFTRFRRVRR